jgi:queuosine precursor transporter
LLCVSRTHESSMRYAVLAAFLVCIPIANWMIGNVGTECVPHGPCLLPVGFGLEAPSGVIVVGVALVLRDLVQRELGPKWAIAAIVAGAAVSTGVASPALAVASGTAFLLSELADMAVYTPLREKRLALAVLASGIVGAAVDSAVFLWLAFGSLTYLEGQIVGKLWASVAGYLVIAGLNRRRGAA